jgi:hypothetical protein
VQQLRKQFFFEKKNQKTFTFVSRVFLQHHPKDTKVFCFFFSKKKRFASALAIGEARHYTALILVYPLLKAGRPRCHFRSCPGCTARRRCCAFCSP